MLKPDAHKVIENRSDFGCMTSPAKMAEMDACMSCVTESDLLDLATFANSREEVDFFKCSDETHKTLLRKFEAAVRRMRQMQEREDELSQENQRVKEALRDAIASECRLSKAK